MPNARSHIFTLTSGRTGTAWLAQLLEHNLGTPMIHEPLEIEDFGKRMPDIAIMRRFNTHGFSDPVRAFWQRKLASLGPRHIETNHTLCKCGLIETLADSPLADTTKVIVLRRNLLEQCTSYMLRNDFTNITLVWQWFLSWDYPNVIVNPHMFASAGPMGEALWYSLEMAARQAYYVQLFGSQIDFIEVQLEDIIQQSGAQALLASLGESGPVTRPPKANQFLTDPAVKQQVTALVQKNLDGLRFDIDEIAHKYIASGRRLHLPPA